MWAYPLKSLICDYLTSQSGYPKNPSHYESPMMTNHCGCPTNLNQNGSSMMSGCSMSSNQSDSLSPMMSPCLMMTKSPIPDHYRAMKSPKCHLYGSCYHYSCFLMSQRLRCQNLSHYCPKSQSCMFCGKNQS